MLDLWYKDAVIYELDVKTFHDSDGNGYGDFRGLIRRLDYIAGLGVNCLWLMPFFPSPQRDDGYDIADYFGVDPRLGSLGDFVDFIRLAREHGIRVLIELAVNHTSDQHPWFQQARQDRRSPFRDYYLWSDQEPENVHEGMVFPGQQDRTWTFDDVAGAWYFHRFYSFQPDLNLANPEVRDEIRKIMGFWIELGVSGFRVDAAPFVIEDADIAQTLLELREFMTCRLGDGLLLAEANVPREELPLYFDHGNKIQMLFNFLVNQRLALALVREDATLLRDEMLALPRITGNCQWANFLRNHDEWDLGRLSDEERREVFQAFGPEPNMQIFGRGLRRRLASMLDGNRQQIELALSLLLSLPGSPVLYYGDEIGMGERLDLDGRLTVRTPMQWSDDCNGGFSQAARGQLIRPVVSDEKYGYQHVNVAVQRRDEHSLLHWVQRAVGIRRECPEFGRGDWQILDVKESAVFAHRCEWQSGAVIAIHNLSSRRVSVHVSQDNGAEELIELLGADLHSRCSTAEELTLEPYGYGWYRVVGRGWKSP